MKEKVRNKCFRQVITINKVMWSAQNNFEAINTLAIPIVTYSFNVINWNAEELKTK